MSDVASIYSGLLRGRMATRCRAAASTCAEVPAPCPSASPAASARQGDAEREHRNRQWHGASVSTRAPRRAAILSCLLRARRSSARSGRSAFRWAVLRGATSRRRQIDGDRTGHGLHRGGRDRRGDRGRGHTPSWAARRLHGRHAVSDRRRGAGNRGAVSGSFWLLVAALLLAGFGNSFVQQYRFAAADAAPPAFKPQAISLVLIGGVFAAIIGPQTVIHTRTLFAPVMFAGAFAAMIPLALVGAFASPSCAFPKSMSCTRGNRMHRHARWPRSSRNAALSPLWSAPPPPMP